MSSRRDRVRYRCTDCRRVRNGSRGMFACPDCGGALRMLNVHHRDRSNRRGRR